MTIFIHRNWWPILITAMVLAIAVMHSPNVYAADACRNVPNRSSSSLDRLEVHQAAIAQILRNRPGNESGTDITGAGHYIWEQRVALEQPGDFWFIRGFEFAYGNHVVRVAQVETVRFDRRVTPDMDDFVIEREGSRLSIDPYAALVNERGGPLFVFADPTSRRGLNSFGPNHGYTSEQVEELRLLIERTTRDVAIYMCNNR